MSLQTRKNWKQIILFWFGCLAVVLIVSAFTRLWVLALFFGAVAVIFAVIVKKKTPAPSNAVKREDLPVLERVVTRSWKPWQAGIAIGVLACFAYLSSAASGRNYPLGVTHGVLHAQLLLTDAPLNHVYAPKAAPFSKKAPSKPANASGPAKKVSWWLILEVIFLVVGSFTSAKLSGKIKFLPRPPDQTAVSFFGGILLGAGSGHCRRVRGGQYHERSGAHECGKRAVSRYRGAGQLGRHLVLPHGRRVI
ncbi:MAG: YeeE/YedE thiosulfate transporter family protein [Thermodesulfobacteriota bacterium]|nr:YeeE/YedE thiosulfate transporter family protein [Thermodesulfobacteriota bacterium]